MSPRGMRRREAGRWHPSEEGTIAGMSLNGRAESLVPYIGESVFGSGLDNGLFAWDVERKLRHEDLPCS